MWVVLERIYICIFISYDMFECNTMDTFKIETVSSKNALKRSADVEENDQQQSKKSRVEYKQQFTDDLFLTISYLNNQKYIHIRRFFQADSGRWLPTREGATFTEKRFAALLAIQPELDACYFKWNVGAQVSSFERFIGGGWCVKVYPEQQQIEIRKYFHARKESDIRRPTRTGVKFHLKDWRNLAECIDELCNIDSQLIDIIPCYETHDSQDQMTRCAECSPYYVPKPKTDPSQFAMDMSLLYWNILGEH